MFEALASGFAAIAADRVLLVIVIGAAVLAAWLVYEVVGLPRFDPLRMGARPRGDERADEPEPLPPEQRVEAIVQSLRDRDARAAVKRKRKSRLVKAKARKR